MLQQTLPTQIVDALHLELYGSVHREAMDADLSLVPDKNITESKNALGGVTTTYIVPTPDLPMLRPLKGFGVPQPVIDALTSVLKPIIDSAYISNDPVNPKPAPGHIRTTVTQTVAAQSATAHKQAATPRRPRRRRGPQGRRSRRRRRKARQPSDRRAAQSAGN